MLLTMQALSATRLAEVLRTHFNLQAPAAPRSDPVRALQDPTPALREPIPAPALLTAGAAATAAARADRTGQRNELDASGRSAVEAPAAAGRGVLGRTDARKAPVQRGAGALLQRRRSLVPCAGTGRGAGARDPKPAGPAAPQQQSQPAPVHWRALAGEAGPSKGLGVQGAGVRPAGRARTPLRPLPLGEQVPDMRHGVSGAHVPAWEAGGARENRVSATPGLAWEGAASAAAAAAAAPAGQLASGWENPMRARAASEPANAAAVRARSAPKRALEAAGPAGLSAQGAPVRGVPGRPSRPLYAHLSLDRLRGSDPGSLPDPDPGLALNGLRARRLDTALGMGLVLTNPGVRDSAQSADAVNQQGTAHARQAGGAGNLHTGPGRMRAGAQSLSEMAGEPLEALLGL